MRFTQVLLSLGLGIGVTLVIVGFSGLYTSPQAALAMCTGVFIGVLSAHAILEITK